MPDLLYQINPDRNKPWNDLPELPIRNELIDSIPILKKLGDAKAALAKLQGRSVVIPNQGMLINSISLQEAKISSETIAGCIPSTIRAGIPLNGLT
jgi:hypothetical protein